MPKIALITDSTAHIAQEEKDKYLIELVPVNVMFEGKVYRDGVDLTASQAYEFLEKNPDDWATSAPSPGDFLAAYKKQIAKGAKEIICLAIGGSISATWNSARMAKEIMAKEMPEVKIEVIDSGTIAVGETLLIKRIGQMIEQEESFETVVKEAENLKTKIRVFLSLETIRYIYRSGRIPEVASKIGGLLPLKPIITAHGGKLHFAGATMSKDKSKEKILKILEKEFDSNLPEIGLMHINGLAEAEELKQKIYSLLPNAQVFISEFSPIIGYAMGKGTVGIGFFAK
ncbi:MAG: DegV family protein [bacterium]